MLYKLFLVGVVIFCSTGIGNILISERKKHITVLKKLAEGCRILADTLAIRGKTISQALQYAHKQTQLILFEKMQQYLQEQPKADVKEIAMRSLAESQEMQSLEEQEREIYGDFIKRIAMALTVEQIQAAESIFSQQMMLRLEQLEQEQEGKSKVVKAMSVSIGLAIAVILI